MKTSLFWTSALAAVLMAGPALMAGGQQSPCCCCPCQVTATAPAPAPAPEATPPAAPDSAVTQQSRSVEPYVEPTPMPAPVVQAAPVYRPYQGTQQQFRSVTTVPQRRLHPSNHFFHF